MVLGDGIRRNIVDVSEEERQRLVQALIALDTAKFYPDGVSYWDKQEEIHKSAHAGGQDVHQGPAFLPWHRELVNRLEVLIREVDPELSLHYWNWTTNPRSAGGVNMFTPAFMGRASGDAGPPLENFESTEGDGHDVIWRNVRSGAPPLASDVSVVTAGDSAPEALQFQQMNVALQAAHNTAHGYIGGTIGLAHFSFHDPFVFLLHSNTDRLFALWQLAPGREWRLDPDRVYGRAGSAPAIVSNLEPWAGGEGLRPWAPPDNQQLVKTCKDASVVSPPRYDTNPVAPPARGRKIVWHDRDTGETQVWLMDGHQLIRRATVLGQDAFTPAFVKLPFEIVGVGDLNGNGRADIVWHHRDTGETQIWYMDGHQLVGRGTVLGEDGNPALVNLPFEIVGVGDLNGNGRADIVWHHRDTGETQIWYMDGHQLVGRGTVLGEDGNPALVNLPFEIVGVGDLNGNGRADIVWHHRDTGETQVWYMDGHQLVGRGTVLGEDGNPTLVNLPFQIVGVGEG